MADIFDKIERNRGPIGQYSKGVHGYFTFPKLEGELGNKIKLELVSAPIACNVS